jgi:hypothetical protein
VPVVLSDENLFQFDLYSRQKFPEGG